MNAIMVAIIRGLEEAVQKLEPPILALLENGESAETLAYWRGARDAYKNVLDMLKSLP